MDNALVGGGLNSELNSFHDNSHIAYFEKLLMMKIYETTIQCQL